MSLLDWIFPTPCAGCGQPGSGWCAACSRSLAPVLTDWRPGVPLVAAGRLEGPWQRAVHEYKYRPRPHLSGALAAPLAAAARLAGLGLDGLACVPLHPRRERERGFNQSERLARALAPALGCRLWDGLHRVRATLPQVGLDEAARRANLAGAFRWLGPPPAGRLGLVDDVATTGATLEAAEAAIAAAGGRVSAVLVLAIRSGGRRLPAQTFPPLPVTSQA